MDWSTPNLLVPHHLLEFAQVHANCIEDAQPTHPLMPSSPSISFSDALFSFCPRSFPAPGTFPMSCLFTSDDQNTETSALASLLPVNIQSWSPLRLTGLVSLLSNGLSGVFSSTIVQRQQLFGVLPSLWYSSHNHTWPWGRPEPWLYGPLLAK